LAHTATSGLVAARRGQDTDLSLMRVTALLPGPQYAVTSTSSWLLSRRNAQQQHDVPRGWIARLRSSIEALRSFSS
jgi:hypothetical protein